MELFWELIKTAASIWLKNLVIGKRGQNKSMEISMDGDHITAHISKGNPKERSLWPTPEKAGSYGIDEHNNKYLINN